MPPTLPNAKGNVARTEKWKACVQMLKDVGKPSGHKWKNEEFQEGTEWKSFLKKMQGVCVHSAHDFHFLNFFYSFLYFPFLLWKSTLNPFPQTITFIKTSMQNYPLLLPNSIKHFPIISQSLTIWIQTIYVVKCKQGFSAHRLPLRGLENREQTSWLPKGSNLSSSILHLKICRIT